MNGGEGSIDFAVRLTPKAGQDAIDGAWNGPDGREVLAARVRAAPDKGAANEALLRLVARELGVPRSAVELRAGGTQRLKRIRVRGNATSLAAELRRLGTAKPR